MDDLDALIGQNLARLRGDLSQAELAKEMKKRGYKWSQATVWAIEKGDRPLRLAEARDVIVTLGREPFMLSSLLSVPSAATLREGLEEVSRENRHLHEAMDAYWSSLNRLAISADLIADKEDMGQIPTYLWEGIKDWLQDHSLVSEALQAEARHAIDEDLGYAPAEMARLGARTFRDLVRLRDAEAGSDGSEDYESVFKTNMRTVGNYSGMVQPIKKDDDGEHSKEA